MDSCPYNADNCPKVNEIKEALDRVNTALSNLTKIVYVMAGIMFCQFGVIIW